MDKEIEISMEEVEDCGTMKENKCDKCEFIGKNRAGLKIHFFYHLARNAPDQYIWQVNG